METIVVGQVIHITPRRRKVKFHAKLKLLPLKRFQRCVCFRAKNYSHILQK